MEGHQEKPQEDHQARGSDNVPHNRINYLLRRMNFYIKRIYRYTRRVQLLLNLMRGIQWAWQQVTSHDWTTWL